MRFLHVIITHLPPEKVRAHLALTRRFTPGVATLIAYGGPAAAFNQLKTGGEFFLEDPSLRGVNIQQCFNELFPKIWTYARQHALEFDFVHVTEYDHIILCTDYFERIAAALELSGADFLGRGCGLKSHSNWPHRFVGGRDGALLDYLRAHSVRENKTEICGTLGNGIVLSRAALQAWAELPTPPRIYNELIFPTLVHHLGFKIGDMGSYSDVFEQVRWGPVWTPGELRELIRRGAACVHPIKDTDAAITLLADVAPGGGASNG
jgi:hypothetical protein